MAFAEQTYQNDAGGSPWGAIMQAIGDITKAATDDASAHDNKKLVNGVWVEQKKQSDQNSQVTGAWANLTASFGRGSEEQTRGDRAAYEQIQKQAAASKAETVTVPQAKIPVWIWVTGGLVLAGSVAFVAYEFKN